MNTRITCLVSALAICSLTAIPCSSQQSQTRQPGGSGGQYGQGGQGNAGQRGQMPPRPPVDSALDVNNDHRIDADEIASASRAIMALDADGDGRLSASECLPQPPQGRGGRMDGPSSSGRTGIPGRQGGNGDDRPAPPIFTALDGNGDQTLDSDEIARASSALLTLDRNGDGALDGDECRPQRFRDGSRGGNSGR